jgi:Peptidase family M1 domain
MLGSSRRLWWLSFYLVAVLCLPVLLTAQMAAEQLARLREIRLDPEQSYRVRDLFLEREDIKLYFTDGHLLFAAPFEGRTLAALFVASEPTDEGEILLIPPTEPERKSLTRFTGQPILNEKFRTAMLFFTDDTADQLRAALAGNEFNRLDIEAGKRLAPNWTPPLRNLFAGLALRTLIDLDSGAGLDAGYFMAAIGGGQRGRFDVTVEPRLDDNIFVSQLVWRDNQRFSETWCRFPSRSMREGRREKPPEYGRLEDFHVEARLERDLKMQVTAKATLVVESSPAPVVALGLSRRLRLTRVLVDGKEVEFLQFDEYAASGASNRQADLVAIVLPASPAAGSKHPVEFQYEGTVVSSAGDGVYYVGSRFSWYPQLNLGFTNFELLFHYPAELDLVATGEQIESAVEGDVRSTRFRTTAPIRRAAFNLGHYKIASKKAGPYTVEVCANERVETNLQPHAAPAPAIWVDPNPQQRRRNGPPLPMLVPAPAPPTPRPADRLDEIVSHSASAVEFFHERFGPLEVAKIVISPIPGGFGQGFAGLVYASTLSYFAPEDSPLRGYSPSQQIFFTELLRTHEIAHQWWGNLVASPAPRDAWLSEALATYSALLFMEQNLGKDARDRVLDEYRNHLLRRNEDGETIESAGAIVLGDRLRSSRFPRADDVIVYEKGAWIMHMLRGMMGDEQFLGFLRRLCDNYRFKKLTTEDFQKEAASFLPERWPDPKLESFFGHWVYGTGIPSLDVVYSFKGSAAPFYFTGHLRQRDVPESASLLVPVEIHTLPGRSLVKWVMTNGGSTEFGEVLRNKPSRVVMDPAGYILRRPGS